MAIENVPQSLGDRVAQWTQAVKTCDAKIVQVTLDRAMAYDQLMQVEAQVLGKSSGWEGVELSGLVPEGSNAYYTAPPPNPPPPVKTPYRVPKPEPEMALHDMEQEPQPLKELPS